MHPESNAMGIINSTSATKLSSYLNRNGKISESGYKVIINYC